ncbi:MAG: hypothetical protein MI802_20485, partial [Desulfobacterales bacterium]|nr:hypothetical protein [Desulfobacterales bacterium]
DLDRVMIDMSGNYGVGKDTDGNDLFTDTLMGIEEVYGTDGNDTILGSTTTRWLSGDEGDDSIVGGDHSGYTEGLAGGAGDDTLDGGSFSDTDPGNSVDYSWYDGGSGVSVDIDYTHNGSGSYTGSAVDGFGDTDTLIDINWFTLSDYADEISITIDDQDSGSDTVWFIWGNDGADTIAGTSGEEVAVMYFDDPGGVVVNLDAGSVADGWGNTDELTDIFQVSGSNNGSDDIDGTSSDDHFFGSAYGDFLDGLGGSGDMVDYSWIDGVNDTTYVEVDLSAGEASGYDSAYTILFTDDLANIEGAGGTNYGNDSLVGDSGDNLIEGYGGDDTISGGAGGVDTLKGGDDGDLFKLGDSSTYDVITDFSDSQSDLLHIEESNAGFTYSAYGYVGEFTYASSGSPESAMDYKIIAVMGQASADWSDRSTVIENSLSYFSDYDSETHFLISNGVDSRFYFFEADTDVSGHIEDDELHFLAEFEGITDVTEFTDSNVDIA